MRKVLLVVLFLAAGTAKAVIAIDMGGDGNLSATAVSKTALVTDRIEELQWLDPRSEDVFLLLNLPSGAYLFREKVNLAGAAFGGLVDPALASVTADGWSMLRAFDQNHDGAIRPNDAVWSRLAMWSDRNVDGLPQPAEITALSATAIREIRIPSSGLAGWALSGTTGIKILVKDLSLSGTGAK